MVWNNCFIENVINSMRVPEYPLRYSLSTRVVNYSDSTALLNSTVGSCEMLTSRRGRLSDWWWSCESDLRPS